MDQPNYHVLVEGRTVGPYDRQTILGMRIKQTLAGDDILVGSDGRRLTVRELAREDPRGRVEPDPGAASIPPAQASPPGPGPAKARRAAGSGASTGQVLAIAVGGVVLVIAVMLLVLVLRRVY